LLEIESGLIKICEELRRRNVAVVMISLPHAGRRIRMPKLVSKVFSRRVDQVNSLIANVCDATGSLHVAIHKLPDVSNRKFWHSDFMHPSAMGHQVIADKVRRELSLPRKRRNRIATTNPKDSKTQRILWLMTKGSIWVARRSIDLLPALVYLILKESLKRSDREPQKGETGIALKATPSHFAQEVREDLLETILTNSYRASASSDFGLLKHSLNERINLPA
jgi:hypothetical protein